MNLVMMMKIRQSLLDYWKNNGIEPPQQMVVCAANRNDMGIIVCSARHFDTLMKETISALKYDEPFSKWEEGFIDQFGTFLTRVEAMKIVKESGQPFDLERNGGSDDELYSEGIC